MIAPIQTTDLPALAALIYPVGAYRVILPDAAPDSEAVLAQALVPWVRGGGRGFGYHAGGALRACLLWHQGGEVVLLLYVAPTWRRRGLARRLVACWEDDAFTGLSAAPLAAQAPAASSKEVTMPR